MPFPPIALPLITAGLGLAGTLFTNRSASRAAKENRDFQERMSSTAHVREVADLRAAGLNPILSANRGASSPQGSVADVRDPGEGAARGVASALAVKQMEAQIELLQSQALESRTRAYDMQTSAPLRYEDIAVRIQSGKMDVQQKRDLMPLLVDKARAEIKLTVASARQATAMAALNELARGGAMNQAEFEKRVGELGPWAKLLFEAARSVPRALGGK